MDIQIDGMKDRQTDWTDRQTADIQTDKYIDVQTDLQKDRQTYI